MDKYLLDTWIEGEYGGTGKRFNWKMVRNLSKNNSIVLAGGLFPENVKAAIDIVNPNVVDVSTGVEIDGNKSFERIKKFIESVRG